MQTENKQRKTQATESCSGEPNDRDGVLSATETEQKHPMKRLLIFQLKLALDALRDFALSPVALFATIADMINKPNAKDSYFAKLMAFGRKTDSHINLFEHQQTDEHTFDRFVEKAEALVVKEYQNGNLSAKAKIALQKSLKAAKSNGYTEKAP